MARNKEDQEGRLMVLFKPKDADVKTKLELLRSISGDSMNDLVIQACRQYLDGLTPEQKKALDVLKKARLEFRKDNKE